MNANSTAFPDLAELQNTLNITSTSSDLDTYFKYRSTSINLTLAEERPTRPSNTLFWLDDVLAKIDLIQNKDEKLGSLLGNLTLPRKPHCGNVGLSVDQWRMYNLFLVLIQYFIPLIVITFAYTKMGLKLRETNQRMNKRNSSKLQRINTASSHGFSSSSVRTTNNNLIVSPGAGNYNIQMAIELQQTGGQTTNQIVAGTLPSTGKRCRSLDCSPLDEGAFIMNCDHRKCSQSTTPTDRHSPQCINCQHAHNLTHHQQQTNSTNVSTRCKHRTSCTGECCREAIALNNNNECLLNKNGLPNSYHTSLKKSGCKCRKVHENDQHEHCTHNHCAHNHSLHRHHQPAQTPTQQSPQHPLQHHSSLQPTGSIHSNLMMPMISHPITALRVNPQTEYIVINKKKVISFIIKF